MIFSGRKRSATWRANRRMRDRGISAPRYQRSCSDLSEALSLRAMGLIIHATAEVDVIVAVSDASGQEIFHTFKIALKEKAETPLRP